MKTVKVVAAIIIENGKVFATQRGYGEFKDGWEFPGGKIEPGETPQEALVREIREELDTEIEVGELLDTVEYDYPTLHLSMDCFICTVKSGDLVLKEHEAAKWLTKETLGSVEWLPADLELVEKIREKLGVKIFYGNSDNIDYDHPEKYAYLNWRFDNGFGSNDPDNPIQEISDNFQLGKGFLGNAIIMLDFIIQKNNKMSMADILIFPIMFNIYHGIELWLKSSLKSLNILYESEEQRKSHEIEKYFHELKNILRNNNLDEIIDLALKELENVINELKKVNANCDFARYSLGVRGNFQFYNAPFSDASQWQANKYNVDKSTVPNTCVNINNLEEITIDMFVNFGNFVECLQYVVENNERLSNEGYKKYLDGIIDIETKCAEGSDEGFLDVLLRELIR